MVDGHLYAVRIFRNRRRSPAQWPEMRRRTSTISKRALAICAREVETEVRRVHLGHFGRNHFSGFSLVPQNRSGQLVPRMCRFARILAHSRFHTFETLSRRHGSEDRSSLPDSEIRDHLSSYHKFSHLSSESDFGHRFIEFSDSPMFDLMSKDHSLRSLGA